MVQDSEIIAIKEILRQYTVSMNEGNFDLWMSLWTEKAIQMLPYSPIRIGKKQIQKRMKTAFDQMNIDVTINKIVDAKVSGDLGLTVVTYTMKWTPKEGGQTINAVPDGKTLTLYERQKDGSWKIAYDCSNLNKRTFAPPSL
jgi:uncharacterized protein (TIGR02246 family)